MNERFVITEEKDPGNAKDTGRLLAAGATRVFRLQASRLHLDDGLTTLLQEFHKRQLIICESNSIRLVVQPDLFFVVRRTGWMFTKPSALEVSHHVDRWIWSDGKTFDLDPSELIIENGQWKLLRNGGVQCSAFRFQGGSAGMD